MIPAEAVEAAAFELYRIDHYGNPDKWPTDEQLAKGRSIFDPPPTLDEFKADYRRDAKNVLEAAAPYMLAEAFEQGQKSGMRHADRLKAAAKIGRPELPGPLSPNPYRPADAV